MIKDNFRSLNPTIFLLTLKITFFKLEKVLKVTKKIMGFTLLKLFFIIF